MSYQDWGFNAPPFQTSSLPASEFGERLLVGRDAEVQSLVRRILSPPKMATVEGLNGVGKTSVVNVASFKLFKKFMATGKGPLVPCRKIFQLDLGQTVPEFVDSVLMEVAQTVLERAEELKIHGFWLDTDAINRWLNALQLVSFQAGVWVVQGGFQRSPNTGAGFERSGFRKAVTSWLETIYPTPDDGAIICMIDNLELLQSSENARQRLEQLRDELFNVMGIRWVLCGSLGIVHGVVSSPRLEGFLHKPIEIGEIGDAHAPEVLSSRTKAYAKSGVDQYLPINPGDFERLYSILRGNIRSVLSYADEYCQWVSDRENPVGFDSKSAAFNRWLSEQVLAAYSAVRQELRPRALEVFDHACQLTVFSPSDYADFGFNSIPAFRPSIRDLEVVGLLVSTQDEGDKRRKTIQVTPKGWMVKHHIVNVS